MKRLGIKLTYANVAATLCLCLLIGGGTAFAASSFLPKNSVGSKQIKKGSIQFSDLSRSALKRLKGKPGKRGATGKAGATGKTGATGPAGPLTTVLPSGQTLRGAFNLDTVAGAVDTILGGSISFGFTLSKAPVVEDRQEGSPSTANCPGSYKNPSAAPGVLCVYEAGRNNVSQLAVCGINCEPESPSASPFGAELYSHSQAPGRFSVWGSWAVTAP